MVGRQNVRNIFGGPPCFQRWEPLVYEILNNENLWGTKNYLKHPLRQALLVTFWIVNIKHSYFIEINNYTIRLLNSTVFT